MIFFFFSKCSHLLDHHVKAHHIVRCPAKRRERTYRFAGHSSFCQVHAFEVLTPTSTYREFQFIIQCMFYLLKLTTRIPSKILSSNTISCTFYLFTILLNMSYLFTMLMGSWEFYHSCPSAGNKQSVHIVSVPAGRTCLCPSAGHTTI